MPEEDKEILVVFSIPLETYELYENAKNLHELESRKIVGDEALMRFIFAMGLEQYADYITSDIDIDEKYIK